MGIEQDPKPEIQRGILAKYLVADKRLDAVIAKSREIYDEANLPNHNFKTHIPQVTYRALLIAESDSLDFNPSVLIAASLLHDAGYAVILKQEGHEEASAQVAHEVLAGCGFSEEEIGKVTQAITDYATPGISVEADILFDADILHQAGYASMYAFFVSLYEYQQFPNGNNEVNKLDNFLNSRLFIVGQLAAMGLRTKKGKEMLKEGFEERKDFIQRALRGVWERPDFLVTFEDLINP